MAMMTSADGWKLKSRPPRPSKKPWITSNKCLPNSSPIGIIMMLEAIITRRSIIRMSNLRLKSQGKAPPSMLKFLKASKFRLHP